MLFRLAKNYSRFLPRACAVGLALFGAGVAGATTTVAPTAHYGFGGNTLYLAGNNKSAPTGLVPGLANPVGFMEQGFTFFDLQASQGTTSTPPESAPDTGANMIQLVVTSTLQPVAGQTLVVVLVPGFSGNPSNGTPMIPLASVGGSTCGGASPGSSCVGYDNVTTPSNPVNSAGFIPNGTPSSSQTIGFYPYDVCLYVFTRYAVTPTGCTTGTGPKTIADLTTSNPGVSLNFTVRTLSVATTDNATIQAAVNAATSGNSPESFPFFMHFQAETPTITCPPATTSVYFPGDGQISIDASQFAVLPALGGAGVTTLVAVAKQGGVASAGAGPPIFYNDPSQFPQRLNAGGGIQQMAGFTNTTSLSDGNVYSLAFNAADSAGIYTGTTCGPINGVRTAAIQGFLQRSNCFIATAAFRSIDSAPVVMLRAFRDQILLHTGPGRGFVSWYYGWSPPAAEWLMIHSEYRYPVLLALFPLEAVAWTVLHPALMTALAIAGLMVLLFTLCIRFRGPRVRPVFFFLICTLAVLSLGPGKSWAEEGSSQPYIDQLKEHLQKQDETSAPARSNENPQPFIESQKAKMAPKSEDGGSYIESLKKTAPERYQPAQTGESYLEQERAKIAPKPTGGAIEAVREGRSELKAKKEGPITGAVGIRIGSIEGRDISAIPGAGLRNFDDVYGSGYTPDVTLFYEFQPFHSEWYGNFGIVTSLGVRYNSGTGVFQFDLPNPAGGNFGLASHTKFQFFTMPVMAGLNYRFNLARYIRPYIQAGPTLIGYYEQRSDSVGGKRGNSRGVQYGAGVAILLDWFDRQSSWDLYQNYNIKQYYLTFDYTRLQTFSGDVNFTLSGMYAGLTFEF